MEELIKLLKEKGDPKIVENLTLILKNNFGILRKFNLTKNNYKLIFDGDIDERENLFKSEIAKFKSVKDKNGEYLYEGFLLERFYFYWSERTQDGKKMRWEKEKTWELSKRLATWRGNQIKKGY